MAFRFVGEVGVVEDVIAVIVDAIKGHLVKNELAVLEEGASDGERAREDEILV